MKKHYCHAKPFECVVAWVYLLVLFMLYDVSAQPYEELFPKFDRTKSPVMIRKITEPTRANLDFAAYTNNPIRFDTEMFKPVKPSPLTTVSELTFGGAVETVFDRCDSMPLTDKEKRYPMAWQPLQNLLWSELKIDALNKIGSRIIAEKWADPSIFKPYQEIAALYIHNENGKKSIWVEIEFSRWVTFLPFVSDDDHDGFKEIYAELNVNTIDSKTMNTVTAWIESRYLQQKLTKEQIADWAQVLASYWYPTLNTDIVDLGEQQQWPTSTTEKKILRKMKKTVINNPVAVIRGIPHNKPLYNVFIVEGLAAASPATKTSTHTTTPLQETAKKLDTAESENYLANNKRFAQEIARYGTYQSWAETNKFLYQYIYKKLAALPESQMGIEGEGGWLYFRKSLEFVTSGDLAAQPRNKNPLPHIVALKEYLAQQNINFLFVVIPNKEEIYPEKIDTQLTKLLPSSSVLNPYVRKFLAQLQHSGVEIIDVFPRFIDAKRDDNDSSALYQKHDTHWTNRGLQIVSSLIAQRIKQYRWYQSTAARTFSVRDTSFMRRGDIVDRLPENRKSVYTAVPVFAQRVYDEQQKPYRGKREDPVLLIGDSFTGVFEIVDCKSAGLGAHIAAKTGLGVDIITSWGGGPLVRNTMMRTRKNDFIHKRLVIYCMVARDLFNYAQGWEPLQVERREKSEE